MYERLNAFLLSTFSSEKYLQNASVIFFTVATTLPTLSTFNFEKNFDNSNYKIEI